MLVGDGTNDEVSCPCVLGIHEEGREERRIMQVLLGAPHQPDNWSDELIAERFSRGPGAELKRVITMLAVLIGVVAREVGAAFAAGGDVRQEAQPLVGVDQRTAGDVAGSRVFFGHQSVGGNILDELSSVVAQSGADGLNLVSTRDILTDHAYFQETKIGENKDPAGKIGDFSRLLRAGIGDEIDVALMKLCYVDITTATDVEALFEKYRSSIRALQGDYPDVAFVHVTTPVTTDRSMKGKIKSLLGRDDRYPPADNAAREKYNQLLRAEYGDTCHVFDLAAVEATTPDGDVITGTAAGNPYLAMYAGYAKDPGHLNEVGGMVAGAALLTTLSQALGSES